MRSNFFTQMASRLDMPDLRRLPPEPMSLSRIRIEVLAGGLTVALALVPEAVAFAFVAGGASVGRALCGLHGRIDHRAVWRRPGMISGATGALAVVMVALVADHGVEYLFATVVLMGIFQLIAGIMHWGAVYSTGAVSGDAGLCEWPRHCDFPGSDGAIQGAGQRRNDRPRDERRHMVERYASGGDAGGWWR